MQKAIILLILATISNFVLGQTNYENFKKLYKDNDTTGIRILLAAWERSNPDDPELYTSAFNYYYTNSNREIVSVEKTQRGEQSFQLTDSTGAVAGYMNSMQGGYDTGELKKAFYYANKGIEKFPNRLDIRFGKCFVLAETGDYEKFTTEIINTVEYSHTIKNNWLWAENKKPDEDPESFMLDAVQKYLKQLYDTENDNLLENMKRIGDTVLKYYPDNIEILSTTAVANLLTKNYDKAIGYLKHAEKLNPKDFIVLNNIAQGYKLKGDKENAIKYYELTAKYGDERAKQDAKKAITELKK